MATVGTFALTTLPRLLVAVMTVGLMPLALQAARIPSVLVRVAWITGAIAALGLVLVESPGALAIASVVPYAVVAGIAGLIGTRRLLAGLTANPITIALGGSRLTVPDLALNVGLVFVPAATTWLFAHRAGYSLLGYDPFWVLLTAAHFHVAGVFLLVILGRITEERGSLARFNALVCVISVPLTAAGIYGPSWLEVSAAVIMAMSAFGAGIILLTTRGALLRGAGAVLLVSMPLAGAFALRDHGRPLTIFGLDPLASMLVTHGALNTLVFATLALYGIRRP